MTTRSWDEIIQERKVAPDYEARMEEARSELADEERAYFRSLAEVRRARDMTQEELAEALGIKQTSVSKAERAHERHADLYLSTLRRFVEAMGGQLHVSAVFADGVEVPIDNFREIDNTNPEPTKGPFGTAPQSAPLQQAI
jgi:transcriptional regulator with XRE-family HTH domain